MDTALPLRTSAYRYAAVTPSIHDLFPPLHIKIRTLSYFYLTPNAGLCQGKKQSMSIRKDEEMQTVKKPPG